jgi:hypothetical protein
MLSEIEPKILRPQPVFVHSILLPALLKRFAELKEVSEKSFIGIGLGPEGNELKILFIAVVITLYDPSLLTGIHSTCMRLNLREELAGLLQTDRTWISQQTDKIKSYLNPNKDLFANKEFKEEVYRLSKVLEIEFGK